MARGLFSTNMAPVYASSDSNESPEQNILFGFSFVQNK
jgi:hypothetical protein